MRAYSLLRPVSVGTYPDEFAVDEIVNFDRRIFVEEIGREAWGYVDFGEEVPKKELDAYEMLAREHVAAMSRELEEVGKVLAEKKRVGDKAGFQEGVRAALAVYRPDVLNGAIARYL